MLRAEAEIGVGLSKNKSDERDHGGGRFAVLTYSQANGLGGLTSYIQEWSRTGDKKLAPSTVRVILNPCLQNIQ